MPFYEYQCQDCNHRVEALQKMSDDPLLYCPECNAPKLKKLISAAAFRLKGTGWYETDFKDKKPDTKASEKSSDGTKTDSKSADSKTSDSKPSDSKPSDSGTADSKATKPAGDSKSSSTASAGTNA